LAPVASLVSIHHLRPRAGLVGLQFKVTGGVSCLSAAWYFSVLAFKPQLESGLVTADLTTTVLHSYKFLIKDVKPVYSLTQP